MRSPSIGLAGDARFGQVPMRDLFLEGKREYGVERVRGVGETLRLSTDTTQRREKGGRALL